MIHVSVITLNYREAKLTLRAVQKLLLSKRVTFEIIIVDNSCTKADRKTLHNFQNPNVHVYIMDKNLGCAKGYNFGIQKAKGKYVFIMNNDTEITDRFALYKMYNFLEKNKTIAVLQPKIKSMRKKAYYEYAGASGGFIDIYGYPFCRGRIFNSLEKDTGQYDDITDISWASTCAFFARKSVLTRAGLFDPIYFAYAEEVDISLKIWMMGYRIVAYPKVEIFHKGESSWKKVRGRKTYLIHRNHLILYLKCFPPLHIIKHLPMRLILEIVSMVYYIFHKSELHIIPVLFSYVSIFILLPYIFFKRIAFFKSYKKDSAPVYTKSIALEHFLWKKNYYSQLKNEYFSFLSPEKKHNEKTLIEPKYSL